MNKPWSIAIRGVEVVLVFAMVAGGAIQAYAVSIPVPNYSFEDPNLPLDPSAVVGDPPGWVGSGPVVTDNPPSTAFTGAAGNGTPTGGDQGQSLFLYNSSVIADSSLWTVQPGEVYTLRVAVGYRFESLAGTAQIGFQLDDAFVPDGDQTFDVADLTPAGEFVDLIWSYTAQPLDAGKSLKVFLQSTGAALNLDNVRLDVVPEPSTFALIVAAGLAVGGVGARRYRRRARLS